MDPKDKTDINLLLNYPLMSKTVKDHSVIYKGSIEVNDEDYKLSVEQTSQNNFILDIQDKLELLDQDIITNIQQTSSDVVVFLDLLKKHISSKIPSKKPTDHSEIYRQVLQEYSEFSKFHLNLKSCYLAYDLSKISVTICDESSREHKVVIKVNYSEKYSSFDKSDIFEIVEYDLPHLVKKSGANLELVYHQFATIVEALQPFFDLMEDFDKNCHILDPIPQNRRYNHRRIWLGETLSVIITVDPLNLSQIPTITLLGPERMVEGYRSTMNDNLENWDPNNQVFSEILKLMGLERFPERPAGEGRGDDLLLEAGDCSICFSHRLNDKLPEIVCRNQFCDNCYHIDCLYEWLMSVNARRFFTEVVGNCPNCEKNISCPIPK